MFLWLMAAAAEDVGLEGVGFADHCNVSARPAMQQKKKENGFNLDVTYQRRREAIRLLREQVDIPVFDAVEIDYLPDEEDRIRSFLDEAGFDYVVGSVHFIDDVNVHNTAYFRDRSVAERQDAVDKYFDMLVSLIESSLADIVAHVDVLERNEALRGIAGEDQYRRVAEALAGSESVPEINAGRLLRGYGRPHPSPAFLDVLMEEGVEFTFGTDSHRPEELRDRVPELRSVFAEHDLTPVTVMN